MKRWIVVDPKMDWDYDRVVDEFDTEQEARDLARELADRNAHLDNRDFYVAEVVANAPLPKGMKKPVSNAERFHTLDEDLPPHLRGK